MAGLDYGGSSLKAWVADLETGVVQASVTEPTETSRPRPYAAEFSPVDWWAATGRAMGAAVERTGRPPGDYAGVTAASLRQGFVLVGGGAEGTELAPGVLNSDRRGGRHLDTLRRQVGVEALYALTGHWPAPELTLPKLLDVAANQPGLWASAERMLFVHDWALWRMSGQAVTEVSYACAGQTADVARRAWATDLLDELGLGTTRLARLVEPATVVGHLGDASLGLPLGLPVISGGGDAQVAALGAGAMVPGTACVVAGSTTPLQAAVASFPVDPLRHPWVSTHLRPDLWVAETNAGYAGMNFDWLASTTGHTTAELSDLAATSEPGARGITATVASPVWSEESWATKAPSTLVGFTMAHTMADVARAFVEAHAYAVRANVDDLERAVGGRRFEQVLVTGGAARDAGFRQLLADVSGRVLTVPEARDSAAAGGSALVARALGAHHQPPVPQVVVVEPRPDKGDEDGYTRYLAVFEAMQAHLPPEAYAR
ncbi:MAG: xylulokinase [Acidimicrobiales bacterium]